MKLFAISLKHIKRVLTHKWYVFIYCKKIGIPFRGFMHDWSKFTPTEFLESIRNYEEGVSPIIVAKKRKGYSEAWQHHKGRNPHHYEYWVDNLDKGGVAIKMPFKYVLEMIADYLGAGTVYHGKNFTIQDELVWWNNLLENYPPKMHPETKELVTYIFEDFIRHGEIYNLTKTNLEDKYNSGFFTHDEV